MSIGGLFGAAIGGVIGFFVGGGPIGAFYGASLGFAFGMVVDPITPDVPSTGGPDQGDQVMSGEVGTPIADLAGTAKIAGHLLCYGGERAEPIYNEPAGAKGGEPDPILTGYKYYMSWALGIVAGEVDKLYVIYKNDEVVWEGELNCPVSGGEETITLDGMGSATFYFGTDDHALNSKVGALLDDPDLNIPYRNLCWCFLDDCYIGEYNRAPTMKFIVKKIPENAFSDKHEIQTYDCNPAHAMWFILHNLTGLPESWLHSSDFASVASTLWGESRGVSVLFDRQQSALNYLESINSHIDSILRYGTDAKFHPKLIRDDYTVGDLPLIDEDVMLEEPSFDRRSWIDTINEMKVQYSKIFGFCTCVDISIGYITQQMAVNEQQTLTVENAVEGCTYEWEITSGGGSLSSSTGSSVVYTAPSSNANCDENPTISLSVEEDVCDTLQIAVNAYGAHYPAYSTNEESTPWSCIVGDADICAKVRTARYKCDGTFESFSGYCGGGAQSGPGTDCTFCESLYRTSYEDASELSACYAGGISMPLGSVVDTRTEFLKLMGCCPAALL